MWMLGSDLWSLCLHGKLSIHMAIYQMLRCSLNKYFNEDFKFEVDKIGSGEMPQRLLL